MIRVRNISIIRVYTRFLRTPPHHCFIWVFQQESDRHERKCLLGICVDRHPSWVTLMHVSTHNVKHARDAGPTKVNIQDANLKDTPPTHRTNNYIVFWNIHDFCTWITSKWCIFNIFPGSFMCGNTDLLHTQLTFLPACLRARANSVVMVLFPTPPFPDRTNTTCRTWAMFPSHVEIGGG